MGDINIVVEDNTDFLAPSKICEPMLFYGSKPRIAIEYVSDIHLLHHASFFGNDVIKTTRMMARSLYASKGVSKSKTPFATPIQLFLGDISSKSSVTVEFYRQYMMQNMFSQYKDYKQTVLNSNDIHELKRRQKEYERRLDRLLQYIKKKKVEIEQIKSERLYDELRILDKVKTKIETFLRREIPNAPIRLSDFRYKRSFLGFVILGNHEYVGFPDVDTAVRFYKKILEPMGYRVLQNQMIKTENAIIYGGSGFAKYSEHYNANNIINCDAMMGNREYEIEQTTLFESEYSKAKNYAIQNNKCFICAAHYPIEDCLGKFDREAVYFTGHTHRNERFRDVDKVLYADNQIGYHNDKSFDGVVRFKYATTDSVRNPYSDLTDGCFPTTPEVYMQFYEYIGEYIGEGKLIRKRCETGNLFVIKSHDYYGFFIVSKTGLSILNGGKTKKISLNQNINWIQENFNTVVDKYLTALEPLRRVQLQISRELKRLGFSGTIHGLIVDIDFYNHIMVNPFNGLITFYYSPVFGQVKQFESFHKQLESMGQAALLNDMTPERKSNAIALYETNVQLKIANNDAFDQMITVSKRTGAYGISRAISPLQRLFTGHVLRDFDLKLIEINAPLAKKEKDVVVWSHLL